MGNQNEKLENTTAQAQIQDDKVINSEENKKLNIFIGDYSVLPKRFPKMVRIFLSSTFTDFEVERNYLIENLYQNLREICEKDYQLDFSLIDMRWGITDESTIQNKTTEICLQEIERCKFESIGPTFIAFLGYKYGNRFLQPTISLHEFKELRKELNDLKLNLKINMKYKKITSNFQLDIEDLMDYCYELDENQLPEHNYKLKSISDIVPGFHFDSTSYEACAEVWAEMQNILLTNIRIAVRNLYNKKTLNYKQFKSYFISVTETEINDGIFKQTEKNDKSIVFFRKFNDYEQFASQEKDATKKYLEHDKESKELLQILKKEINDQLPNGNLYDLPQVGWFESNKLDPENETTKAYLEAFGVQFLLKLGNLIGTNYRKAKENSSNYENSTLFEEITNHVLFCRKLQERFYARDDILEKITKYVYSDQNTPFILYGSSGSGKSSIMASLVAKLKSNKSFDSIVIIRFMGTSRESCRAYNVLKSIIEQLEYVLKCYKSESDTDSTFNELVVNDIIDLRNYLKTLLETVNQVCPNKRIVILLDSIDQLTKSDYDTKWMLFELPRNTKIIYTTRPIYGGILDKIKSKLPFSDENSYELRYLYYHKSIEIIKYWMKNEKFKRDLDTNQWAIIESILKNGQIYPLFLKLMFDIVSKWPSKFSPDNEFYSFNCVKNGIKYLFDNLAIVHGKTLFSRCLFYLTLFENGLSENELVDILSIDDNVLTSVFQYHEPPTRKFPFALWLRIKHDLSDYLTEKDVDDTLVLTWYHSAFMEVAKELYIDSLPPDEKDSIIKNAIDYFIETWRLKPKPFLYSKKISKKKNSLGSAQIRKTKPQKIFTEIEIDGKTTRKYNKRKLNELINLVLKINDKHYQAEIMIKHIYFDYEFMHAKAVLKDLGFVIDIHNVILCLYDFFESEVKFNNNIKTNIAEELLLISSIFKENYLRLQASPNCLAHEVMSRLRNRSEFLERYDRLSIKDCGLLVTNSYLKLPNEKVRVVYFPNHNEIIYSCFFILNKPFMFVCTIENLMNNSKLYLIDHVSSKILDIIDLKCKQLIDNIILIQSMCLRVNPNNNYKKINDMIGYMLIQKRQFIRKSTISSLTFENEVQSSMDFSRQSRSVALNKDTMLVISDNTIMTLNVSNMQIIEKKTFEDEISDMSCNISSYSVIIPEFEKMEKYVLITFPSRKIELYRLDYERKLSLFWSILTDSLIGYFKIDSSFLMDKMLEMKSEMNILNKQTKMRFATIDEMFLKVFTINSDSTHSEKRIRNDQKTSVFSVFIIHFAFDIILYSCSSSRYFLYDLSTGYTINIDNLKGICQFFTSTKFIHFNVKAAEFYELGKFSNNYKIAKAYEEPFSINGDLNFDNVQMIGHTIFGRASDKSLVKLDINSKGIIKKLKQNVATISVKKLFYMLNENHVLALNENEFIIINCMSNEIINSKSVQNYQFKISKNYLLLLNNEERMLTLNFLKTENNQFKFIEIMRRKIERSIDIRNLVLNEKLDREVTISIEDITKRSIDLFIYKYDVSSNTHVLNVSEQYQSINDAYNLIVTLKSNYVLLQTTKAIYNVQNDNKVLEIKFSDNLPDFRNYNIFLIDDSDDFITYFERRVFFFKCVLKNDRITYIVFTTLLNIYVSAIMVKNGLIFFNLSNLIIIFNINEIRKAEKFVHQSAFKDRKIANVHTDEKNNYLVYTSDDKILKLIKLKTSKTIGELIFRENIADLIVNEKFVSVKFENKQFASFIIIDKFNDQHKKILEDLVAYKKESLKEEQNQDYMEYYLDNNFHSDLFQNGFVQNRHVTDVKYLEYLEDLRKETKELDIIKMNE